CVYISNLHAQEKVIQGVVTTFDSIPLFGADITAQSSKETVKSDTLGNFSIACEKKDKLKVTAKGFYSESVKLDGSIKYAAINLRLKSGENNLENALGFTLASDRDKLSAMASQSSKDIDFSIYNNIYDAISGKFAGVQVINGELIIRGNSTINGTSPALVVVDGVPVNSSQLSGINPAQVKSINVIKDGSSAIYGSRGANGVVEITTKSGKDQMEP
ncbi:MAG: TonB-dependent receptor plug domain-containing protein, partial [Saprospiraceae bacterium]|nr:TonB-dependent receptor plug domain-containing protein [Saprospiraceae bacterium]